MCIITHTGALSLHPCISLIERLKQARGNSSFELPSTSYQSIANLQIACGGSHHYLSFSLYCCRRRRLPTHHRSCTGMGASHGAKPPPNAPLVSPHACQGLN
uniref:Uncharacterized protein n=1 Tax=Oryza punctata TaxID=4537 RepID=A0A0E0JUS1_ORYPU